MYVEGLAMLYQYADSGDSSLVVIAVIALIIFVLMLLVAFIIVRSEGKIEKKTEPEEEHTPPLAAEEDSRLLTQDNSKGEHNSRRPALGEPFKRLNWWACCIIASIVAFFGYDHVQRTLLPIFQIPDYYYWSATLLAILSPACLAVAWVRITGLQWRRALVLYLLVPVGAFVIWYIVNIVPYWFAS
jgi:hypothetical protein